MVLGCARLGLYWGQDGRRGQGERLQSTYLENRKKEKRVGRENVISRSLYLHYCGKCGCFCESVLWSEKCGRLNM